MISILFAFAVLILGKSVVLETSIRTSFSANRDPCSSSTDLSSASGSTGVRFSGDKVRVFNGSSPLPSSSLVKKKHKNKINMFPSPSEPEDSDRGFLGGGAACDQWAVVTTIHLPNLSINRVADLRNWCLVIVGDTITPDDAYDRNLAKKDNVFYLSASYQKEFLTRSLFIDMMPFKSFARKNIGYLFAINFGAQVIFDFDDDNILLPLEDGETIPPPFFHFGKDRLGGSDRTVLLKFINSTAEQLGANTNKKHHPAPLAFNPYIFMGASHHDSWPRGFPMDKLQNNYANGLFDTTNVGDLAYSSIGVIQSLCNGDPDNDAVFRMTRPDSTNFTFERSATSLPLLIPSNAYSPYNAQATTHLYNAFWGLYLPITVPGRVTDIWRSYITQRIMKDIGLHVMYTPPIVQHERSAHDYLSDFVAESDLYDKTTKLLEFLDGWSSDAHELPERIFELWVGLYEHDYLGLHDVEAAREWLNTLIAMEYKFPSTINSRASMILPQSQPSLDGQPYRSLPHFSVGGKEENDDVKHRTVVQFRPDSAVVKLIMMTMDEWPLLKSWVLVSVQCELCCCNVLPQSVSFFISQHCSHSKFCDSFCSQYHGHLIGFENLYILDSSTDTRCKSFLRYARDSLGANVLFTDANLNQITSIMTKIGRDIGGSSDLILKVDTDEFLTVHDDSTNTLTASLSDYLSGFAKNEKHPLRLVDNSRVGYKQSSMPSKEVCKKDIYSTPEQFSLGPIEFVGNSYFKEVSESKQMAMGRTNINLGGHAHAVKNNHWTKFGIVHYHYRCVEIEVENCKRVLERHNYISSSDTDQQAKHKLAKKFRCAPEDMCNTCDFKSNFNSHHKASFYLKWLDCPERMKKEYYDGKYGDSTVEQSPDIITAMHKSHERFAINGGEHVQV